MNLPIQPEDGLEPILPYVAGSMAVVIAALLAFVLLYYCKMC